MENQKTCIIVGGSVFGLAAALGLRKRGYSVKVFERTTVPAMDSASTDINKAVRCDYDDKFYMDLAIKSIKEFERWNQEDLLAGVSPTYHPCGVLLLTRKELNAVEQPFEHACMELYKQLGMWSEDIDGNLCFPLSKQELEDKFPAWKDSSYSGGYFTKFGGYAESGRVVERMAKMARLAGIEIIEEEAGTFTEFIQQGDVVVGIKTLQTDYFADKVVMATGAWSGGLIPGVETQCMATGQTVLHFTTETPEKYNESRYPVFFADISKTGFYGFPLHQPTGLVKFAIHGPGVLALEDGEQVSKPVTELTLGKPPNLPESYSKRLTSMVQSQFPDLKLHSHRLCWYCDTTTGDFLICAHPTLKNLYVATGGSGHGFKFAPVLDDIIADVVEDMPEKWKRFSWQPEQKLVNGRILSKGDGMRGSEGLTLELYK